MSHVPRTRTFFASSGVYGILNALGPVYTEGLTTFTIGLGTLKLRQNQTFLEWLSSHL